MKLTGWRTALLVFSLSLTVSTAVLAAGGMGGGLTTRSVPAIAPAPDGPPSRLIARTPQPVDVQSEASPATRTDALALADPPGRDGRSVVGAGTGDSPAARSAAAPPREAAPVLAPRPAPAPVPSPAPSGERDGRQGQDSAASPRPAQPQPAPAPAPDEADEADEADSDRRGKGKAKGKVEKDDNDDDDDDDDKAQGKDNGKSSGKSDDAKGESGKNGGSDDDKGRTRFASDGDPESVDD